MALETDLFKKFNVEVKESDCWHPRGTIDVTSVVDCKVSRSAIVEMTWV